MRGGHQKVARSYVLYREQRNSEREALKKRYGKKDEDSATKINVTSVEGKSPLDTERLNLIMSEACAGIEDVSLANQLQHELKKNIYDGITQADVSAALVMSSRVLDRKGAKLHICHRTTACLII